MQNNLPINPSPKFWIKRTISIFCFSYSIPLEKWSSLRLVESIRSSSRSFERYAQEAFDFSSIVALSLLPCKLQSMKVSQFTIRRGYFISCVTNRRWLELEVILPSQMPWWQKMVWSHRGGWRSMLGPRGYFARTAPIGLMSPGEILLLAKCMGILDMFVLKKNESSLVLAIPILVKARDHFLRI